MEFVTGLISVIMSNFNTEEKYLRPAIESVLNQTYENFEFIIIDDGSTNDSVSVIKSYNDSRIKLLINEENIGLTKSLNVALGVSRGEFIARMDADDICLPTRFERQVAFLRKNDSVIVCGTAAEIVSDQKRHISNRISYLDIPERDEYSIRLMFGNDPNIIHISAMFNNIKLHKFGITYNENYRYAQDYRMWVSCCEVADFANINEVLMKMTIRDGTISTSKK